MKRKNVIRYLLLALLLSFERNISAQSGPVASGGEATGSGGNMSYSIGQIDYITASGSGGIATEGIQQPYEVFSVNTEYLADIQLVISMFPNPVRDFIHLTINDLPLNECRASIHTLEGKLVLDLAIKEKSTLIDVSALAMSTYIVDVWQYERIIKTFKIIKNI